MKNPTSDLFTLNVINMNLQGRISVYVSEK